MRMGVDRSERGSLPVVMMAILIVGSLVTVLVGTVVVGQGQTRFDQGFEQSLSIAEIGLERMVYEVTSRQETATFSLPETAASGGGYSGTAVRDGREWTLTSTGVIDGRQCPAGTPPPCTFDRTLTLTIEVESLFNVAAYGRTQVELQGSNTADSYRSGTLSALGGFSPLVSGSNICRGVVRADPFVQSDSGSTRMCTPTGKGVVATNAELFLKGGVIDGVDRAEIHYAREVVDNPLPGATGFCAGVTATCNSPKLFYYEEPIATEPDPVLAPAGTKLGAFPGPSSGTAWPDVRLVIAAPAQVGDQVLSGTSFRVTEGGESRPVSRVETLGSDRLEVALALDTSGSMVGAPLAAANAAARSSLAQLPATVPLSMVGFGASPAVVSPRSLDRAAQASAVNALVARGQTGLYDALNTALAQLPAAGPGVRHDRP